MPRITLKERLLEKCQPVTESGCWIWDRWVCRKGYGRIGKGGTNSSTSAHRASWEVHFGPIPGGMQVLHKCDVAACINPAHLYLGTHADNMVDRSRRGRQRTPTGKAHPHAGKGKLNAEQVAEILQADFSVVGTQSALARKFGVTHGAIHRVRHRTAWAHFDPKTDLACDGEVQQ